MMAIPSQTEMFGIVLSLMSDGQEYSRKAAKKKTKTLLKLSDEDVSEKTSSGECVYASRVGWAISYLERAGLIDRVRRAAYAINDKGKGVLARNLKPQDLSALLRTRIATENPWHVAEEAADDANQANTSQVQSSAMSSEQDDIQSPREQIESLHEQINEALGRELLGAILDRDSDFFEKLVVDLLVKMGYGKGIVTQRSSDGGIDGIITTDELGFHPIYTQAKRYRLDRTVIRSEVQSFAGALGGVRNGIFITTSSFSRGAIEFARNYPHSTISLIDGKHLVNLMIKYDLGVTTVSTMRIKRLDMDYFLDES